MADQGAFLISRELFDNKIWSNPTELRLFLLIVGKAVFADDGVTVGGVYIQKGQWVRSYRHLQEDLEYIENNSIKRPGIATVDRIVKKLVKDGRILAEPCETGTLFTVVNYAKYQALGNYKGKARNSSGTAAEQQRNNNNNANNAKNDLFNPPIIPPAKIKFLDYVYLTPEEHERLVTEFGHEDTRWMIWKLDNYIGQNPKEREKKWTDHNRVIRGWVKDRLAEEKAKVVSINGTSKSYAAYRG